jgi:hypothetical protein
MGLGTTGGGDRLLIIYNQERFDLVRSFERMDINLGGNVRAPQVAHFRLKPAGPELLFMVNHLYRTNTERRHEQARFLNTSAHQQTLPVLAVGDGNLDWDVQTGDTVHDQGDDLLTADGVLTWVRPPRRTTVHPIRTAAIIGRRSASSNSALMANRVLGNSCWHRSNVSRRNLWPSKHWSRNYPNDHDGGLKWGGVTQRATEITRGDSVYGTPRQIHLNIFYISGEHKADHVPW